MWSLIWRAQHHHYHHQHHHHHHPHHPHQHHHHWFARCIDPATWLANFFWFSRNFQPITHCTVHTLLSLHTLHTLHTQSAHTRKFQPIHKLPILLTSAPSFIIFLKMMMMMILLTSLPIEMWPHFAVIYVVIIKASISPKPSSSSSSSWFWEVASR